MREEKNADLGWQQHLFSLASVKRENFESLVRTNTLGQTAQYSLGTASGPGQAVQCSAQTAP